MTGWLCHAFAALVRPGIIRNIGSCVALNHTIGPSSSQLSTPRMGNLLLDSTTYHPWTLAMLTLKGIQLHVEGHSFPSLVYTDHQQLEMWDLTGTFSHVLCYWLQSWHLLSNCNNTTLFSAVVIALISVLKDISGPWMSKNARVGCCHMAFTQPLVRMDMDSGGEE